MPFQAAGIDPSSSVIGLGLAQEAPRLQQRIRALVSVRVSATSKLEPYERVQLGVWPVLDRWSDARIYLERPPPKAKRDKRGAQAQIGSEQSWIGGWCVARYHNRFAGRVEVATWRAYMVEVLKGHGRRYELPKYSTKPKAAGRLTSEVRPAGPGRLTVVYSCGHLKTVGIGGAREVATSCLACAFDTSADDSPRSRAMWVRDQWKRLACEGMAWAAPTLYAGLVETARARSRQPDRPDHVLSGVSDACEAGWLALRGCPSTLTPGQPPDQPPEPTMIAAFFLLACAHHTPDTAEPVAQPEPTLMVIGACEGIPEIGDDLEDFTPTGWYLELGASGVRLLLDTEPSYGPDGEVALWRCPDADAPQETAYLLYCPAGWLADEGGWLCVDGFQPADFTTSFR